MTKVICGYPVLKVGRFLWEKTGYIFNHYTVSGFGCYDHPEVEAERVRLVQLHNNASRKERYIYDKQLKDFKFYFKDMFLHSLVKEGYLSFDKIEDYSAVKNVQLYTVTDKGKKLGLECVNVMHKMN